MNTKQKLKTGTGRGNGGNDFSTIHFTFKSNFDGKIDVSTDYRDYRLLRDVSNGFSSSFREAIVTLKNWTAYKYGSSSSHNSVWGGKCTRQFKPIDGKNIVLEPQLNIIGEWTNIAVDWVLSHLDMEKDDIPKFMHKVISNNAEIILYLMFKVSRRYDHNE